MIPQLPPEIWTIILKYRREDAIKIGERQLRHFDYLQYQTFLHNVQGNPYKSFDYNLIINKISCGMKLGLGFRKQQNFEWVVYLKDNPIMYASKTLVIKESASNK